MKVLFLIVGLFVIAAFLVVRPFQSGLVAHRTGPDGTQSVVTQSWNGLNGGEFYTVRLHARKPGGPWTWYYIDHEAGHWSGCSLHFSGDGNTLYLGGGDDRPRSFDLTRVEPSSPPPFLPEEFKDQP